MFTAWNELKYLATEALVQSVQNFNSRTLLPISLDHGQDKKSVLDFCAKINRP